MAQPASVHIAGLESLGKSLRALPKKVEGKIVRTAMRNGTKLVADATKKAAPVDKGTLKKSFAVRALKRKKGRVGNRVTMKNVDKLVTITKKTRVRYFYPAVLEYGTEKRVAHPFMRPAFEQTAPKAENQIGKEIGEGIIKAATVPPGGK